MKTPRILVVGSINMDLCMYGVEGMPRIGASSFCSHYEYLEGGKGSNQAFAAARLGAKVVMVGRVGHADENGRRLLESLVGAGVNTDYIVRDSQHPTGFSLMSVLEDGKYYSVYAQGANAHVSSQDVQAALEQGTYDMVLMSLEMPLETAYRTYEMARERKIPVFLDAGPAMEISLERFKGVAVISPNEIETKTLTGFPVDTKKHILEAARRLYEMAEPEYVLLKLGERGALLYDGEQERMFPAFSVNAVDTTAAGDTFGAAFGIRRCQGASMEEAIRFAHAAAAVCVTRKGGHASIPSMQEAQEFYERSWTC